MFDNINQELYGKIEKDINYSANIIQFNNISDKDDFKQDCWADIFAFANKNSKISRLSAKFIIKKNAIKIFRKKTLFSLNDMEFLLKSEYNDLTDEIISNENRENILKTIDIVENALGITHDEINLKNPKKNVALKGINFDAYRKLRNQYDYYEKKSVSKIKELVAEHKAEAI
jgi:hypothetical protein